MRQSWIALTAAILPLGATAQQGVPDFLDQQSVPVGEGWTGFLEFGFLANSLLTLILATILGAALAFHPKVMETADTLEEIDARKVYMLYSVIGALIGMLVVKYGLVVGFVLFGIGGLIRFRTVLGSAVLTGQVIFSTLIGLACGLDLPHVAVLATAFGFVLIFILHANVTFEANIRSLPPDQFAEAAAAYRSALEGLGCKIIREKKNPMKQRLGYIFLSSKFKSACDLESAVDAAIDPTLRGSIDWEIN
ncbi:MAG TPA: MgtC/SapB family protein [Gammaproteobacteria bacterium]|nr:MgtC/SapB family protein [Gammaproteobacteria bacterium]